jgi:transcriptional regulator with XRE-family HTH domain
MEHNQEASFEVPDYAVIGCRVREARNEYGLTQQELAKDVGVDPKHISRIESGHRRGSDALIRRISEVTGKPLSFFYGNAPMPEDASDDEKELLRWYRKAAKQDKKLILNMIKDVVESRKESEKKG